MKRGRPDDKGREGRFKAQTQLITEGVIEATAEGYRFACDHSFKSPSAASETVLGIASNGWRDWVDAEGRELQETKPRTRLV
ncbi:DUF4357 domain-containing protein [Salinibacterium sp. ZJ454]|uniref:DUF4357 domain-containing protein n=1 Tax=Salinibacterium sp. ZJ454 TaxID=2708339 RepID=UPI001FBA9729|nr:DUF4357 domain-containing protein [Salinibacterium sp. ZJ454]